MSAKAKVVQLNFRVPTGLANRVRADARRFGKNLDDVGTTIVMDFYNAYTLVERRQFFDGAKPKRLGRKVKAK